MSEDGKEIAATTLQQLGNYGKMKAMIGIHNLVFDPDGTSYFYHSHRLKIGLEGVLYALNGSYSYKCMTGKMEIICFWKSHNCKK